MVLSGHIVITEGAVFSEELRNSSSLQFKSLAFDVQQLVRSEAFTLKENRRFSFQYLRAVSQNLDIRSKTLDILA